MRSSPSKSRSAPASPSLTTVAGRYALREALGRGGAGSVYRARDAHDGAECAVKLFEPNLALSHVLREFRVLARLDHPGCVPIRDFGHDPAIGPYLVMDVVHGVPADRALGGADDRTILRFAAKVLDTLGYLHARGVHHGDLKPDNILCAGGDPERPILIDFGLAAQQADAVGGGTLSYMAPELFRGAHPSPRTDLYALGATLYHLAAGAAPHEGTTPLAVLRDSAAGARVPLRERRVGVNPALARLVAQLMRVAPGERPPSARHAQEAVAHHLGESLLVRDDGVDPTTFIGAPVLVGRDAVVERFDALAGSGLETAVLELAGARGMGRTRLLDELELRGLLADALVVRWSGRDAAGPHYGLEAALQRAVARGGRVADALAADAGFAAALARVQDAETTRMRSASERRRGSEQRVDHVTELFRLAGAAGRLIFLLDDLERAGSGAIKLVDGLVRGLGGVPIVAVVAVERPELVAAPESPEIVFERLALEPLGPHDIVRLVETAVGQVDAPEALARWLADETGGAPADVLHTLRWLVATRRLARNRGRWLFDREAVDDSGGDDRARRERLARRRLDGLAGPARAWLRAAALMGRTFAPEAIDAVEGLEPMADTALEALLRARVVVEDDGLWPLRFGSGELVRLLVAELSFDEARAIRAALVPVLTRHAVDASRSAAERLRVEGHVARLELRDEPTPERRRDAERTATALRSEGVLEDAAAVYAALEQVSGASPAEHARYEVALGELAAAGERYEEAIARWRAALDGGLEGAQRVEVSLRLGRALVTLARYDEGVATLRELRSDPDAARELRLEAALEVGGARTLQGRYDEALAAAEEARALAEITPTPRDRARVRKLRGTTLWHAGQWEGSLADNQEALRLFEEIGDDGAAAEVLMAMGTAERHRSNYDAAVGHYREALERFERLGMTRSVGKCQNNIAIIHYYRGHFTEALSGFEAALQVSERTGERVERVCLLNNIGSLYRERGLLDRSTALLLEGVDLAKRLSTDGFLAMMLGNLGDTLGRAGEVDEAQRVLEATIEVASAIGADGEIIEAERRMHELVERRDPAELDVAALEALYVRAAVANLPLEKANTARLMAAANRARGELGAASLILQAGFEALDGTAAGLEIGRLELERARLLSAEGATEEAAQLAHDVAARFEELDAAWDVEQARAFTATLEAPAREGAAWPLLVALKQFGQAVARVTDLGRQLALTLEVISAHVPMARGKAIAWHDDGSTKREAGDAAMAPEPGLVERMRATRRPELAARRSDLGGGAVLALPVTSGDALHGCIYLESEAPAREAFGSVMDFLESLASSLGVSLAQRALVERDRERVDGIVHVAHELRTPLTALFGYLQIAAMHADRLDEGMRDVVRTAASEAQRLSRMVDNLNNLARLEHHNSDHTITAIGVDGVARDVVRMLEHLSGPKGQRIEVEALGDLPPVLANRDHLIQIFTNLLSNAIRFTPEGGLIRLEAGALDGDGRRLDSARGAKSISVSVIDSGPGIPPDKLDTIFAKFSQAGGGAARRGGLGVGLAIAKGLVERYEGRLWADNAPDGGAVFTVVFPILTAGLVAD